MKKGILIKTLLIILTLAVGIAVFVACGTTPDENDSNENNPNAVTYTVTFDVNGGNNIAAVTVNAGENVNLPNAEKTGNTFAGWYDNANFDGNRLSSPYTPTKSITLYAKWSEIDQEVPPTGGGEKDESTSDEYFTFTEIRDNNEVVTAYSIACESVPENNIIKIPAKYNGKPVTSIEDWAFNGCSSLTSIEIPAGVTSIGDYAFEDCSSLTSIEIPAGVTSIGDYAFRGCSSLTSIEIPDSVTSIGEYAFYNCGSLASIEIPFVGASKDGTENTYFGYIFGASSYGNSNYVPSALKTVIITGGASIGSYAFYGCSSLTSIEIPDSVTSIGDRAVYGCINLTSIEIPAGVTSIGEYAFCDCRSLTSIEIPAGVTSIGNGAFA